MEPGLRTYILKRVGFAVLMLVGVSIILFTIMRLAPGGPEAVLIGGEFSQEAAAQIRQRLGLDWPIALQYLGWAGAAVRGDLGRSFKTGDPVAALILDRLARQGIEPRALSPEAFNALLRADFAKMARVVKASGARID